MRVLVLGGASVVGSHVCDQLIANGDEVVALDDLSSGSFANVAHLKREPRFVFVEHDVTLPFRADVEAVVQLALPSSLARYEQAPVRTAMTCLAGTMRALDVAAANRAPLLFVPSIERAGHGIRGAEGLALDDARLRSLDLRIVRIPSTYGPRSSPDDGSMVTAMVLAALGGQGVSLPAHASSTLLRLSYVEDAARTIVRTLTCAVRTPPLVAPSVEVTGAALAAAVQALVGASPGVVATASSVPTLPTVSIRVPSVPSTKRWLTPSIDGALPAELVLGVSPATELAEGLRLTMRWYENKMKLLRIRAASESRSQQRSNVRPSRAHP